MINNIRSRAEGRGQRAEGRGQRAVRGVRRAALYLSLVMLLPFCAIDNTPAGYSSIAGTSHVFMMPLMRGEESRTERIELELPAGTDPITIRNIRFIVSKEAEEQLESVAIYDHGSVDGFDMDARRFSQKLRSSGLEVPVRIDLEPGKNYLWVTATLKQQAPLDGSLVVLATEMVDSKGRKYRIFNVGHEEDEFSKRKGLILRRAGEKANAYRIPGLITTKKGTLIAVYDVRYQSSNDLPGDIDVGMSRSVDGGLSWEPMRIIMDMGKPHDQNGIGDPCILYDSVADKIIVAALWSKGNRSIKGSGPGLSPDETGQLMITESRDDGRTWSEKPRSITAMVKDPAWRIFFQAPGMGIMMKDGKLVMPVQYWDASGMPYATIMYSEDHGASWKRGKAAASNTTESQVVETEPGVLMLNMRDNKGGFRTIATTKDMGQSWDFHPSSQRALQDPICMAGLLKFSFPVGNKSQDFLLFSNPLSSKERVNLSIRVSADLGMSWSGGMLIDERKSFGYSVMTRIDPATIGLIYEGTGDLYFLRIPISQLPAR